MAAKITLEEQVRYVSGAQVAVVEKGRVLIQLRPFPPGWELPGGHIDGMENPEQTAVREVLEETGLEVHIEKMVGVYYWKGLRTAGDVLYLASLQGGKPQRSLESLSTRFVAPQHLPRTLFPWCRQRIFDALAAADGAAPLFREQKISFIHLLAMGTAWMRVPVDAWLRRRPHR